MSSQEYQKLHDLNKKQSTVLVVGAGFIGVEWAARAAWEVWEVWEVWEATGGRFRDVSGALVLDGKVRKSEIETGWKSGNDESRI